MSLPMLIAMECPHKDADAGHLRGLHATLPASPSLPSLLLLIMRREVALFLANFSQVKVNSLLTVRVHKDCLFNWLTKNILQALEE